MVVSLSCAALAVSSFVASSELLYLLPPSQAPRMICRTCLRARSTLVARPPSTPVRNVSGMLSHRRPVSASAVFPQRARSAFPAPRLQPASCRSLTTSGPRLSGPESSHQEPAAGLEKPTYLTEGESQVWDILVAEFSPTELVVRDISGGCGSMYGIDITSEKFRGLNMLKQQRLVNAALGDLMKEWHGVQLKTRAP
ncbi:hypothetical protein VTJ83DRAFT_2783 [Remersonia thermophila]|uniref:Bola-like protein n=1 Tax=Remersonia thermophila TaxID=72144 RepID=A0ABR4DM78_9PEZI